MSRLTMAGPAWRPSGKRRARVVALAIGCLTLMVDASPAAAQLPPGGTGTQPPVRPGGVQPVIGTVGPMKTVLSMAGAAPTNVRANATGPQSIEIRWTAAASASGYWVSRASGAATSYYDVSPLVSDTTWTDNGVQPGTAYSYKVAAVYPAGSNRSKGISESASASTLAAPAPTGLAAVHQGRGVIAVRWDKLAGASWYRLFRDGGPLADVRPIATGTRLTIGATSFTDSVPPGTHIYQLQAIFHAENASDVLSPLAPQPPVAVTVPVITKVKYCMPIGGGGA